MSDICFCTLFFDANIIAYGISEGVGKFGRAIEIIKGAFPRDLPVTNAVLGFPAIFGRDNLKGIIRFVIFITVEGNKL